MPALLWHGGLMLLAWFVLLPGGALAARFFKVLPGQDFPAVLDNRAWWQAHLLLQYAGSAVAAAALWIAWDALDGRWDWSEPHAVLGTAIMALCALQVGSGMLRGTKGGPTDIHADPADPATWRGDHYDMTLYRRLFEGWHKRAGYAAFLLAVPAAWLGLGLVAAPLWARVPPLLAAAGFAVAFGVLTRRGRRVDTWVAIWGPPGAGYAHPARPGASSGTGVDAAPGFLPQAEAAGEQRFRRLPS